MYNLNKKQKIIFGILGGIVAAFICYYVYGKEESPEIEIDNSLEIEEQVTEEVYSDDTIFVHVSGAVNKEGIIELKVNSRISDAIEKAGGVREDAYVKDINLAYKLEDGMKIYIPTIQENEEEKNKNEANEEADITQEHITTSSGIETNDNSKKEIQNSKININTATQTQLETIPGIGPSTALKIIDYREENGDFKTIEDIKEVSGIGEAKFEKMKNYIRVK